MQPAWAHGDAVPAGRVPDALAQPLREFLFETDGWLRPRSMAGVLGVVEPALVADGSPASRWRRVLARVAPPCTLDTDLICRDLRGRLALLSRSDWLRLGMCLCVLPSCGQIQRSLDGHFRRMVAQLLEEESIQALDRVPAEGLVRPVFLAGPTAWRTPEMLAAGGVRAAMAQVCPWPDPVALRVRLHFEPEDLEGPPSVSGLDNSWLEIACKALWPDHPWLWS